MSNIWRKENIKYIPLIVAIFLIIYLCLCYIIIDFSIIIMLYVVGIAILNILLYYILSHPIDERKDPPNFFYIFIKILYVTVIGFSLLLMIINIFSAKLTLPKDEKFQYMIVFGAAVSEDERKNNVVNKRIEKAIEYYKKDNNIIFVLSGGKGENELLEEANYMKETMINAGVKADKILVDIFSTNTFENITNSLTIIQNDMLKRNVYESFLDRPISIGTGHYDIEQLNIGFISSEFHMFRINMMARKNGIKKPYDVIVNTNPFYLLYYYLRENLSIYKAFLLGELKL